MRVRTAVALLPVLAVALALTGCSDSGTTQPEQQGGQEPQGGQMTALIDGAGFSSDFITIIRQPGIIAVNGADFQMRAIGFQIPDTGTGTFTLGAAEPVGAGLDIGDSSWGAGGGTGSGSITVTSRTEARMTGTFSFVVEGLTDGAAPASRSITNGQFDVEL